MISSEKKKQTRYLHVIFLDIKDAGCNKVNYNYCGIFFNDKEDIFTEKISCNCKWLIKFKNKI